MLDHGERDGTPASSEDWMTNVVSGFFAGHETTRWTLCTMIYEVQKNPQTLERVAAELSQLEEVGLPTNVTREPHTYCMDVSISKYQCIC